MRLHAKTLILVVMAGSRLLPGANRDCAGPVVKLRVLDGLPAVDCVFVNQQGPFRFLVDTGSQVNMLDPRIARKAGLKATFHVDVASALEVVKVSGGDNLEVSLGGVKADKQRFLFSGMEDVRNFSPDIQGVLGQDFLSHFDYLIDLQGKRMEFGKAERPGTRVQLRTTHGVPSVVTSLGPLLLDSGAGRLVLFGVEGGNEVRRVGTVSGSALVSLTAGKQLVIEGRNIPYGKALTVPARTENVDAVGLLPARLFKAVYVCNSEGYAVLD
jgi:hypothetical protein